MDGPTFEERLRKDWAYMCSQIIWGPGVAHFVKQSLCQILNLYQADGEIAHWEVSDFDVENRIDPRHGPGIRLTAIVRARFPIDPYSYQVCLGFDSDYPPILGEPPPKSLDRWEQIAMEIEDEVSLLEEELQQKDRANTRYYVANGNVPYVLPTKI